jgi:indole-3-glycerol phosphate synthase
MPIPSILQKIVAHKRGEVDARKAARPQVSVAGAPPVRDFAGALRGDRVRLIAEVKQASPSKGVMRAGFDPVSLARTYAENGAACISVLTDEAFFRGHDRYLVEIRQAVDVPLLRKEFIIDPWQIAESRALGADAVLLIVAILTPAELRDYQKRARDLGMAALVEAHTEDEVRIALDIQAPLIGINNRNLHTFETTLDTTARLAALALERSATPPPATRDSGLGTRDPRLGTRDPGPGTQKDRLLVSESGISTAADVALVARQGARAVLVGEALVREGDAAAKVRELAGVPLKI